MAIFSTDSSMTAYGSTLKFTAKNYGTTAKLTSLCQEGGKLYPEFSPDTVNYIMGISDGMFENIELGLPHGATSEITYAKEYGDTTKIIVTSANGDKKTYSIRYTDMSQASGLSNATEANSISVRDSEKGIDYNTVLEATGARALQLYTYRYNKDAERYPIIRFDLTDVNVLADNIYLDFAVQNYTASTMSNYKINVFSLDSGKDVSLNGISYQDSIGNKTFVPSEIIACIPLNTYKTVTGGKKYSADITDYVRESFLKGDKTVEILMMGDQSGWLSTEVETSSDRGLKNIYLIPLNYTTESSRPSFRWEGE